MSDRFRRKQLFVNRDLQRSMILAITWPPAVCFGVAAIALVIWARRLHEYTESLDVELPGFVGAVLVALFFLFVSTAFIVYHALHTSHRFAGPAYRMKRDFERVRAGDLSHRVRLRDGDGLVELADDANELLDWVEQLVQGGGASESATINSASSVCEELPPRASSESAPR